MTPEGGGAADKEGCKLLIRGLSAREKAISPSAHFFNDTAAAILL